jgi:hypothetical protein
VLPTTSRLRAPPPATTPAGPRASAPTPGPRPRSPPPHPQTRRPPARSPGAPVASLSNRIDRGGQTPRRQHPRTRRAPRPAADQLSLDHRLLGTCHQHGCHLRHPESPPGATTKLAGGLSRVHERAKPANYPTTAASAMPTPDVTQKPGRAEPACRSTGAPNFPDPAFSAASSTPVSASSTPSRRRSSRPQPRAAARAGEGKPSARGHSTLADGHSTGSAFVDRPQRATAGRTSRRMESRRNRGRLRGDVLLGLITRCRDSICAAVAAQIPPGRGRSPRTAPWRCLRSTARPGCTSCRGTTPGPTPRASGTCA